MFLTQQDSYLANFTQILMRPLQYRCAELAVLFDRGSLKDLHSIFPLLVDSIFGPVSGNSWELRGITNLDHLQTFDTLQHFLCPQGPFFKLIYALLKDPLLKFNFNLNFLPSKVRPNVVASTGHPFYMDLIHVDLQTNQTVSLMLNPFDYYFFHFAYYLINPIYQRYQSLNIAVNTVYYTLCCDYILHFLPTNPSVQILPNLSFYHGKNPIYTIPSLNKPAKVSKLLRADIFSPNAIQGLEHHPRNEIWRSETVMTVFIDMWLNNDQVLNSSLNFDNSYNMSPVPFKQSFKVNEMPTGEYIRILRVFIKHLHGFASSAKADDTHLGDLKRIVIPYLQGRMYILLRHIIHRWPLDGSFRIVLELWLSFIQPWRYPGNDFMQPITPMNLDIEEINMANTVGKEHMKFLAENLLAYTVLLQQLLPRFSRVDLASPKIALILYRACKVFGQLNLNIYLREIEEGLQQVNNASPMHSYHINHYHSLPPLSPTSKWSTNNSASSAVSGSFDTQLNLNDTINSNIYGGAGAKWGNIVKQKILEYEGPNFCYKPIFSGSPADEVHELIRHIKHAKEVALHNIRVHLHEMREQSRGFFGYIKSLINGNDALQDEFTIEERNKVPVYLDLSLNLLIQMFNLPQDLAKQIVLDSITSTPASSDIDMCNLRKPRELRERVKKIRYEGDPDLRPIQSYEVKVLVRMLYQLSLKINTEFGPEISNLYYSDSFLGRLSRQILCPPVKIHRFDKSSPGFSPRVAEDLPPRISFRYFANFRVIFYSILLALLSRFFGYSYFTPFFFIISIWFSYICLKTFCEVNDLGSIVNTESLSSLQSDTSMDVDMSNDSFNSD